MGRTGNILARKKVWADARSFLLGEYHRLLRKHRSLPLPARGRAVWLRAARLNTPVRARLGTSDFLVMFDLLSSGAADGRGEYDAAIDAAARHAGGATHVRIVLDLGANIGLASMMLARAFPSATVIAVEPDADNFALLNTNTRSLSTNSHAAAVHCHQACIGATRRTVTLDRSAHSGEPWAIAMKDGPSPGSASADRVETITLADVTPPNQLIDLLKCDIEGTERELFEHCGDWIRRVQVMVVELHAPYRREQFLEHVRQGEGGPAQLPFSVTMLKEDSAIQVLLLERIAPAGNEPRGAAA